MTGIVATFAGALSTREKEARDEAAGRGLGPPRARAGGRGDRRATDRLRTSPSAPCGSSRRTCGPTWGPSTRPTAPDWQRLAGFALDSARGGARAVQGRRGPRRTDRRPSKRAAAHSRGAGRLPEGAVGHGRARAGRPRHRPCAQRRRRTQAVVELGFLREAETRALQLLERVGETIAVAMRSARLPRAAPGAARRVRTAGRGAPDAARRAARHERGAPDPERRPAPGARAARRAQRGARGDRTPRCSMQRNDLERAATRLHRGEGGGGRAREPLQVRVPREHVARAADAAQQLAHPREAPRRQQGREPHGRAGEVRDDDLRRGQRPARAHQRHPRPLEGRSGQARGPAARASAWRASLEDVARTIEPLAREKRLAFTHARRRRRPAGDRDRRAAAPADPEEPALERAQVHRVRRGLARRARRRADHVAFVVHDTGIGIAPEQQEAVFEAFRQADGAANRRFGGHRARPLDLAQPRAHCSAATCTSRARSGEGSTFTLDAPSRVRGSAAAAAPDPGRRRVGHDAATRRGRERRAPRRRPASPTTATASTPSRRLVLVVEDDAAFAEILLDLAHELDFQCLVAHSADEGVQLALERVPSAILLDMKLPDHSGLSVLDRLKRDPATRHIPVHVVLGRGLRRRRRSRWARRGTCSSPCSARSCSRRSAGSRTSSRAACAACSSSRTTTGSARASCSLLAAQRRRDRRRQHGRRGAREAAGDDVRLRRHRPGAARRLGRRPARAHGERRRVLVPAGHRLHRPLAHRGRGAAAAQALELDHRQGRAVAGAPARRGDALPAPGRVGAARRPATDAAPGARPGDRLRGPDASWSRRTTSGTSSR